MSCPIDREALERLRLFVDACKTNPAILHLPELRFFKDYLESLGGNVPSAPKIPKTEPTAALKKDTKEAEAPKAEEPAEESEDDEAELEFDMTGCVEPDKLDDNQKMGDPSKETTEEDRDNANLKRNEAQAQLAEGNIEKAIELFTEAIELHPQSALLLAKRGQAYLKLTKPNACIRDCTRALELNPDSATAYKFRGRAYRLLGEWELAAKDLRQACNIDLDEEIDEWLKEVTPNAKKIEEFNLRKERKAKEREEREKLERIRRAREAHAKAAEGTGEEKTGGEEPEGASGMGDFYKLLQDPEIMAAFQDPEVAAAFQDISMNPGNFNKYQSNPKIMALITKLSSKFSGSGMNFPGFPGAGGAGMNFPGFPGAPPPTNKPADDDNLD